MPNTPQQSGSDTPHPHAMRNRLLLLLALAMVAVVTVVLVRSNMEPPPQTQSAAPPPVTSDSEPQTREEAMAQVMEKIDHIKEVLASDSTSFDAWSALGNLYFDAAMPDKAVEHYRKALEIKPGDTRVMTDMATMMRELDQSEDAADVLEEVVNIDSNFVQAWFNLGVIYTFDLKDAPSALAAWERYLAIDPTSPHADAVRQEIVRIQAGL